MTPEELLADLNALCDGWVQEYRFYPGRRCAFDYAHPRQLNRAYDGLNLTVRRRNPVPVCGIAIAIETEGGVWMSVHGGKSRHFTGSGASSDMKKYNAAEVRGWTVLRYPDNAKRLSKKTVETILRDVRTVFTGIAEGQRTRDMTVQCKLLSEVIS